MRIIRRHTLESTAFFRKFKATALIGTVLFSVLACIGCTTYSSNKYSAQIYESAQYVEKEFYENQEKYLQVACLLKDSGVFDYLYAINRESIYNPSIPRWSDYFSTSEYEYICDFFNELRPYEIGRAEAGVYFVFLCKTEDVTLYYTELESDSLSEFLAYRGQHGSINKIKDNWYCRVRGSDVIR